MISKQDIYFLIVLFLFFFMLGAMQTTILLIKGESLPFLHLLDNYGGYIGLVLITFAGYKFYKSRMLESIISDILEAKDKKKKKKN